MTIELGQIRDLLLPGLLDIQQSVAFTKEIYAAHFLNSAGVFVPAAPAIIIPSLPAVLAMGAAAKVIENPDVTRRSFVGWLRNMVLPQ